MGLQISWLVTFKVTWPLGFLECNFHANERMKWFITNKRQVIGEIICTYFKTMIYSLFYSELLPTCIELSYYTNSVLILNFSELILFHYKQSKQYIHVFRMKTIIQGTWYIIKVPASIINITSKGWYEHCFSFPSSQQKCGISQGLQIRTAIVFVFVWHHDRKFSHHFHCFDFSFFIHCISL